MVMRRKDIPKDVLRLLDRIKGKRARIVIDHILKHGSITTEILQSKYGYDHPPRAIRDVIEQGVPLAKIMITGDGGRRVAEYSLGDLTQIRVGRIGGRRLFSKTFKGELLHSGDSKCNICQVRLDGRALQVDHRVPYEVAGEGTSDQRDPKDYMLLCTSCNRAKSWSCEHCRNWSELRDSRQCLACYWGHPEKYSHVALEDIRRLDLVWRNSEVPEYDELHAAASSREQLMPDFVKETLRRAIAEKS